MLKTKTINVYPKKKVCRTIPNKKKKVKEIFKNKKNIEIKEPPN